jgi:two-component system phosphate regulon sensor histidine kinase PhoR
MFRSVRWRIVFPYVGLILLTMLALGIYLSNFVRQSYIGDLESKLADEARMIGDVLRSDLESVGANPNLDPQAKHWASLLDARVTIIAPDGIVWGESHEDRSLMSNHRDRPEVIQALTNGVGYSMRYSQTLGVNMMYTAVMVVQDAKTLALVRVALPLDHVNASIASLQRVLIAATLLSAVLALLIAILIAGRISLPIRQLTQSVLQLAPSKPSEGPIPPENDEISQLAQVFNLMSVRLNTQINDLKTERATFEAVLQKMTDGVLIVDAQGEAVQHLTRYFSWKAAHRSGPSPPACRDVAALPGNR